jgi:hypothetical protein
VELEKLSLVIDRDTSCQILSVTVKVAFCWSAKKVVVSIVTVLIILP